MRKERIYPREEKFDSAIEKATAAQKIFKKRNDMSRFIHTCELLGAAYFRQGNLTLSRKSYLDAFDAVERIEGKLKILRSKLSESNSFIEKAQSDGLHISSGLSIAKAFKA